MNVPGHGSPSERKNDDEVDVAPCDLTPHPDLGSPGLPQVSVDVDVDATVWTTIFFDGAVA